ncbi:hypothetical protein TCE0_039f12830 [Talaromyces pinophilus]|jgi:hypothetical protein|uniref:Uncharacterized protein n=1 Tax=Talaromyces pinophilus TaxID=128442 RepID=A0A6N4SL65_TALPI|nr:hypothetical protein TCE0_039f12830 [Talaromyces pinophilus]
MSYANPTPIPPTTILTSRPISQSAALDFLKAYLDRAANDPSLQPSAMITEHGPASRTTAAAPNLTLHNLKRVQAGLAGEILGRDLSLTTPTEAAAARTPKKSKGGEKGGEGQEEQWENKEKWELEQGLALGADEDGTELLNTTTGEEIEVDEEGMPVTGPISKEERKRRKKERRLAERKTKRQQAREAGEEEMETSE